MVEQNPPLPAGALENLRGQLGRDWEVTRVFWGGPKARSSLCVSQMV